MLIESVEQKVMTEVARRQLISSEAADVRDFVLDLLRDRQAEQEAIVARQERRLAELYDQREKLLQGYYAAAVPIDQMKVEQGRIAKGIEGAGRLIEDGRADLDRVRAGLNLALDFVSDCGDRYAEAPARVRRRINQALFVRFVVGDEDEPRVELAEPFNILLSPSLREAARGRAAEAVSGSTQPGGATPGKTETSWPNGVEGLSNDWLVDLGVHLSNLSDALLAAHEYRRGAVERLPRRRQH